VNAFLSAVSTTPAINCSVVSTTPLTNLSAVLLTPAINLCHGFSLIGGVIDTSDKFITVLLTPLKNDRRWQWLKSLKFIAGVNDTAEKLVTGVNDTADKFYSGINNTCD
jgi:hypothetical protein